MSAGVRLEGAVDILPREVTLRPLRDQIVVKPLAWTPSKTIVVTHKHRTLRGTVVAVGPGAYLRHYRHKDNAHGIREKAAIKETHYRVPMDVKVGDVVELGGLENGGYAFQEVMLGTERHVICQQADVVGIHA